MKKLNIPFIKKLTLNKTDEIFKQLPAEKKERQVIPFLLNKQIKGAISLACATTLILSGSYSLSYLDSHENNVFSTDSFSILADGKELCKIRDPEQLDTALEEIEYDLEEKHKHDLAIENNFKIEPSKAKDKEVVSGEELYNIIAENANYSLLAYEIIVDKNQVGIVNSEYEAKNVIEEVKNYFTQNYDEESIIEISTQENVEINQINTSNADIKTAEELINYIIKGTDEEQKYIVEEGDTYWTIAEYFNMSLDELISANPSSDPENIQIGDELNLMVPKPFLNVLVKRKITQEEKKPFETEYQYVSYMFNDEQIVERSGEYGLSKIESLVTEQNGIQRFGSRSGGFHRGLDMAKSSGSSIQAADGGTVISAGWDGSYGYSILINHGAGFSTRYAHCSDMYVSAGDKVYQGEIIAAVGSTGVSTGPHLHFEVIKYGSVVNPSSYIY